jgi:hypothetical protein
MTELCIQNLSAVLTAWGSSVEKVVKVNVFLTTMDHFVEMNGVYEKFFKHKPARSCVAVYQLPKGVPIEIECIALAWVQLLRSWGENGEIEGFKMMENEKKNVGWWRDHMVWKIDFVCSKISS